MKNGIKRITVPLGLSVAVIGGVATSSQAQEKEIHRIVTTIDKSGKSAALFNGMVPLKIGGAGKGVATLWVTAKSPADFSWDKDRSGERKGFAPNPGGTQMLIVDFPAVGPEVNNLDINTMMNAVGADALGSITAKTPAVSPSS
jgi:hypothetical protein